MIFQHQRKSRYFNGPVRLAPSKTKAYFRMPCSTNVIGSTRWSQASIKTTASRSISSKNEKTLGSRTWGLSRKGAFWWPVMIFWIEILRFWASHRGLRMRVSKSMPSSLISERYLMTTNPLEVSIRRKMLTKYKKHHLPKFWDYPTLTANLKTITRITSPKRKRSHLECAKK